MTKRDIAEALAKTTGLSNKDALKIVNIFFESIKDELVESGRVNVRGFGTFKVVLSKPKVARDINKDVEIHLPPRYRIKFIPSRLFLEELNA
ncbi:MAG TPA: integration host factor subunit beta [Firmicutes bacterium]|uniref:Integration host factor subunit beta n=1 Tax=Candidatus Coatesbacteria bacterium 4484_99 TaxID=1970774 RepID=A0A1W9S3R7_9BACT|nr:MAG: hypothetical protein B6D57_00495 [Candidatus Coatesbacteria bacterium 4484_99]RLC40333.1 MAG: integration host factor subunit beta [Candidatus Coatesbacteria bacterium]RLC43380.1 MAG: integration host factor subunit beta [Candidatus Coatesbacteria bacterium]RLC44869.1 MAG: integration host factor subunit beta [Candidatus Coatesbacteria bacterium]HDM43438.1 integration host factor subunit beta [Bacillota bacterium]